MIDSSAVIATDGQEDEVNRSSYDCCDRILAVSTSFLGPGHSQQDAAGS